MNELILKKKCRLKMKIKEKKTRIRTFIELEDNYEEEEIMSLWCEYLVPDWYCEG